VDLLINDRQHPGISNFDDDIDDSQARQVKSDDEEANDFTDSSDGDGGIPEVFDLSPADNDVLRQHLLHQLQLTGHDSWYEEYNKVPLDSAGRLSSIGSIGHSTGACRICTFVTRKSGCVNGIDCTFCHLRHLQPQRRLLSRACKGKRNRYKKLIAKMVSELAVHETFDVDKVELPQSVADNPELKADFMAKLRMHAMTVRQKKERGEDKEPLQRTRAGRSKQRELCEDESSWALRSKQINLVSEGMQSSSSTRIHL